MALAGRSIGGAVDVKHVSVLQPCGLDLNSQNGTIRDMALKTRDAFFLGQTPAISEVVFHPWKNGLVRSLVGIPALKRKTWRRLNAILLLQFM